MLIRPDRYEIAVSAYHFRGVFKRLAALHLRCLRGYVDRTAAELRHRDLERHSCASRRL